MPDAVKIFRITHIENLPHILDIGKVTCPAHPLSDPDYIGIGDTTVIAARLRKPIGILPFGTFDDYVSFYFTPKSPMLYAIQNGFKYAVKRNPDEIVYLVSNVDLIKRLGTQFIIFDGHALNHLSKPYVGDAGLAHIDMRDINARTWNDTIDQPERSRKKQAELLVHSELHLSGLLGIGVYNEVAKEKIIKLLVARNLTMPVLIKSGWYY